MHKYCFKWRKDNKGKKGRQIDNNHYDDYCVTTTISDDLVLFHDYEFVHLASN